MQWSHQKSILNSMRFPIDSQCSLSRTWQLRFCWTLWCSEPGERPISIRTASALARPQSLHIILYHLQPGLFGLPLAPLYAFPHPILFFVSLHLTKPPPLVFLQNTTSCLYAKPISELCTSFLLSQRDTTHPPNYSHTPVFIGTICFSSSLEHSSHGLYLSVWVTLLRKTSWEYLWTSTMHI